MLYLGFEKSTSSQVFRWNLASRIIASIALPDYEFQIRILVIESRQHMGLPESGLFSQSLLISSLSKTLVIIWVALVHQRKTQHQPSVRGLTTRPTCGCLCFIVRSTEGAQSQDPGFLSMIHHSCTLSQRRSFYDVWIPASFNPVSSLPLHAPALF